MRPTAMGIRILKGFILLFALVHANSLTGQEKRSQPNCRQNLLTTRQSIELCKKPQLLHTDYGRFAFVNPLAKPAFYEHLGKDLYAGDLLGLVGDEVDIKLLTKSLESVKDNYQSSQLKGVSKALAVLGDRGYSEAYKALDNALSESFLSKVDDKWRGEFVWDVIMVLRRSNHPKFKESLEELSTSELTRSIHKKIKDKMDDLISFQKNKGDGMRIYRIADPEKEPKYFKILLKRLKSDQPASRALDGLAYYRSKAVVALPEILKVMESQKDIDVTVSALMCLTAIGPPAKNASPGVRPLLKHGRPSVCINAILALARIGDVDSMDAIVERIGDENPSVKLYAITALGMLERKLTPEVGKKLEAILEKDETKSIKEINPQLFGLDVSHGNVWPNYVPEVLKTASSNGGALKCAAAFALGKCGYPVDSDIIKGALESNIRQLKFTILETMSESWKGRSELIPIVLPQLKNKDEMLSVLAIGALGNIGIIDPACSKAIADQINKGFFWKNIQIIRTLGKIGDQDSVKALKKHERFRGFLSWTFSQAIANREVEMAIKAIEKR